MPTTRPLPKAMRQLPIVVCGTPTIRAIALECASRGQRARHARSAVSAGHISISCCTAPVYPWHSKQVRKFKVLIIVLAAALLLAGCTGSNSKKTNGDSPETRLQDARSQLDAATYLGLKMTGSDLPKNGSILVKVSGTGTHEPPAFTGTATVKTSGQEIKADLIALDKVVYAKLPFVGWNELDPAEYGAPDPAALMAKENGISSLLTDAAKLKDAGDERDGSDVRKSVV